MTAELEERRQIVENSREGGVTLDGHPAHIVAWREKFAQVHTNELTQRGRTSAEFSWDAVKRVLANGGNFRS